MDRNGDCRAEIDALQAHVNLLESQNKDLNTEMQKFVDTDEQIRTTLNRRDRVSDIRVRTDRDLQQSMYNLEKASPTRRR